jgi:hypothetical protein
MPSGRKMRLEEGAERLARDALDHEPKQVDREAVVPHRPGLVEQRGLRELL